MGQITVTPSGVDRSDGWSIELVGNIVEMGGLANVPDPKNQTGRPR